MAVRHGFGGLLVAVVLVVVACGDDLLPAYDILGDAGVLPDGFVIPVFDAPPGTPDGAVVDGNGSMDGGPLDGMSTLDGGTCPAQGITEGTGCPTLGARQCQPGQIMFLQCDMVGACLVWQQKMCLNGTCDNAMDAGLACVAIDML